MQDFNELGLPEALNHTLAHMQFITPTPIQAEAIPYALQGKDVLGSAQTGTGKTGAFGIPLITRLLTNPRGTALVMTPTRELAMQVMTQLQAMLGKRSKIKTALLIGGDSMPKQLQQLRQRPRLMVGTPGRINDHLERGSLMLHDTGFLVLDETDRMLDMGFTVQIDKIMKYMPAIRQTMLFSATLPPNIVKISQSYLRDPVRVAVSPPSSPAANISHEVVRVSRDDKYKQLLSELHKREGSAIVFMKTKYSTEHMARKLSRDGYDAEAIHGDLRQNKRERVIAAFRKERYRVLVATDIAARGLDIPHIAHVINYDLPQCPEDYIHRIGRTARAGAQGSAMCLITPADEEAWHAIHRLMDPDAAGEAPRKPKGRRPQRGKKSGYQSGKSKSHNAANANGAKRKPSGKAAYKTKRRNAHDDDSNTNGKSNDKSNNRGNPKANRNAGGKPSRRRIGHAQGKPARQASRASGATRGRSAQRNPTASG